MRFQKKLLIHYVVFFAVSVTSVFLVYVYSSRKRYGSMEYARLQVMAGQMVQQMDLQYSSMEMAGEAILSDGELLEALRILKTVPEGSVYREEAKKQVTVRLNAYYLVKRYYRALIYSDAGDVFASYDFDSQKVVDRAPRGQRRWTDQARAKKGRVVLIPPGEDLWGLYDRRRTYGMVRGIVGYGAYLEVQQTEESLDKIFHTYDDNIRVMAMLKGGEALYGTADRETADGYRMMGLEGKTGIFQVKNPATGKKEIVSAVCSDLTGMTILLIEDSSVIMQKMSGVMILTCSVLLMFTGIFAVFIYHGSKKMAEPVNELRQRMEHMNLDNLEESVQIENSIDEIRALSNAYGQVIKRLKESLVKEKNLSYLQLQAHYDLLQAQINPHFFYNVMNVISGRALSLGDETICQICSSLSGMFRYATGNRKRYATMEEEIGYLEKYLYLMKLRYMHRLSYTIEVDERLKGQILPKIVFQQIVENSIKHGFGSGQDTLGITVEGRLLEERGLWQVEIADDGMGISQGTAQKLGENMDRMKKKLEENNTNIEMEFGGMGLLNTYARLTLLFGGGADLSVQPLDRGTKVVITAPFDNEETGSRNAL